MSESERTICLHDKVTVEVTMITYKRVRIKVVDQDGVVRSWGFSAKANAALHVIGGRRFFPVNYGRKWWNETENNWMNFSLKQQNSQSVVLTIAGHPFLLRIFHNGKQTPTLSRSPSPPQTSDQKRMAANLLAIRENKEMSDFVIVDAEETRHDVHTQILAPLWPFFAKLLNSGMVESSERVLHLEYSSNTVEGLLAYFYGTVSSLTLEQALALLLPAKVYLLPDLELIAEMKITASSLKDENCFVAWQHAHKSENSAIREYCASYYVKHVSTHATAFNSPLLSTEGLADFQGDLKLIRTCYGLFPE